MSPRHSLLAKCLRNLSGFDDLTKDVRRRYLLNCRLVAHGGYPKPFDANTCSGEGPPVGVAESTICDHLRGLE